MIIIGVTGGIGSGKTYICEKLKLLHFPVYDCDAEAKRMMVNDDSIRQQLIGLIGTEAYSNGKLNKPVIASYLFQSQEHVSQINAIVHPRVLDNFMKWTQDKTPYEFVFMESAILYESRFDNAVDGVIAVTAPENIRIQRAMRRDQATETSVRQRMDKQLTDDIRCKRADYIICNDGTKDIDYAINDALDYFRSHHK